MSNSDVSASGVPIQLKFVTEINDQSRKENVAFEANGLYYIKGNSTYLQFNEEQEYGTVKTIVKITDNEVLILRSGAVKMRQLYRNKEITKGMITNQMGSFEMVVSTNNIEYKTSTNLTKGKLFLTYSLMLQGENAGRYAITISFKEE